MAIVSFGKPSSPKSTPITTDLDGWKPVEGFPTMKTYIEHATADGKYLTGFWEATPGTYQVTYNVDEMVHMLQGKATLTDAGGDSQTYVGGDSFLVTAGSKITWKTVEAVRKIFAIKVPQDATALFGD
ncbi:MAG: cupin domain-containing protein [Methylotenera sp.]